MEPRTPLPQTELTSLVISPNRDLAQMFAATLPVTRAFHILGEMKIYPPAQTLDIRLRQLRPDLVFLDLATDMAKAAELIEFIAAIRPPVFVVGLHTHNDPDAIVRSLRAGATEFLYAPFDLEMQRQALSRIIRLRKPPRRAEHERGRMVVFASAKPGSGASTLACQTAYALRKSGKRILLADFDLANGSVAFFARVIPSYSLPDALQQLAEAGQSDLPSLVANADGIDVLPAPGAPGSATVDPDQLHDVLEAAREPYDWIVIDLPCVFEKLSLLTMSDSDEAFVVTTGELSSLHLTRKAVAYLGLIGFGPDRYRVLVNRLGKQEGISTEDMAKIFGAPVHASFPNDYLSIHKSLTTGTPLGLNCPLGKSVDTFSGQLAARAELDKKKAGAHLN
jgi:pilus assembly protein CpaE